MKMPINPTPSSPTDAPEPKRGDSRQLIARIGVFAVLAAITLIACYLAPAINASPQTGVNMDLPAQIDEFAGEEQEVSEAERIILPDDTEFAKMLYTDPRGNTINAQIVLAGSERRSIHRPEVCLPGQGWTIKSEERVTIDLANGTTLPVTMLRVTRPVDIGNGETKQLETLFLYWFVGHNISTPSHLVRVVRTNLDVLMHNTNHRWAYVVAAAPVLDGFRPNGKDSTATLDMLKSFIADLAPQIMKAEGADEYAAHVSQNN